MVGLYFFGNFLNILAKILLLFLVPCPTNLLFSCVPNVAPVPCQSVHYEKQEAHIPPPPPPPPVYTRPAPNYPQQSYRSDENSKTTKRENERSDTGSIDVQAGILQNAQNSEGQSDSTDSSPQIVIGANAQDWS